MNFIYGRIFPFSMRWIIFTLLFLAACTQSVPDDLNPGFHGNELPQETNMPPPLEDRLEVTAGPVTYYADVNGYLAQPAEIGDYPGIIMIHEWWGLNDHIRNMADELASQGYVVLAVDLFGTVAATSDEARAQVQAFNQEEGLQNMQSAINYLHARNVNRIGSLGWCFGGGQSLQLAKNADLDATVMYYGNPSTQNVEDINQPVLGIFGAEDGSIPLSSVEELNTALDAQGIENDIIVYPGVGHAFANPSGDRYAPDEAADAWQKTTLFLAQNLK